MTTLTYDKIKTTIKSRTIYKELTIAVCVGVLYFTMLVVNPLSALSGIQSLSALAKIRWGNTLRALVLYSPSAAVGIATASFAFNTHVGRLTPGYITLTLANLGLSVLFYNVRKLFKKKSAWSDLLLLASLGAATGFMASINLASIAVYSDLSTLNISLAVLFTWKVFTHIMVCVAGYPILKFVEGKFKRKN